MLYVIIRRVACSPGGSIVPRNPAESCVPFAIGGTIAGMDQLLAMSVFTRVAERGSFAQAADELDISRAAASGHVAALEKHLGVRLLNRTTRRVSLTAEGADFLRRCRRILDEVQDAEETLRGSRSKPQGLLRVDVPVAFGRYLLLPALPGVHPPLPGDRPRHPPQRPHRRPRRRARGRRGAGRRPCSSPGWWRGASPRSTSSPAPRRPTLRTTASRRRRTTCAQHRLLGLTPPGGGCAGMELPGALHAATAEAALRHAVQRGRGTDHRGRGRARHRAHGRPDRRRVRRARRTEADPQGLRAAGAADLAGVPVGRPPVAEGARVLRLRRGPAADAGTTSCAAGSARPERRSGR